MGCSAPIGWQTPEIRHRSSAWLVSATYRFGHETLFYAWQGLLLGIYFFALCGVFRLLAGALATPLLRRGFALLLVAAHAAVFRLASGHLLGVDYPWYLQAGVAGQYILGPMLQPSAFGVLLLLSVYLFLAGRPWSAAIVVCAGASIHTTYLLSAACLTLAYQALLWRERRQRDAVLVGALALLLISPILLYTWSTFAPTSPSAFAESQRILARFRLPHHAMVGDWLDWIAVLQCAWIAIAIWLERRHAVAVVMLFSFVPGLVLTVVQQLTGSDTLALMFPWRVSVYLVPLATTVVLTAGLEAFAPCLDRWSRSRQRTLGIGLLAAAVAFAAGGVWISSRKLAYGASSPELALFAQIRTTKQRGDVYLLPFDLPLPRGRKGSLMRDFSPQSAPPSEGVRRPVDRQFAQFRLRTGAPIFVDFKSIPYRDLEVLEWYRRLQTAQSIYRHFDAGEEAEAVALIRAESITQVVLPAEQVLHDPRLQKELDDGAYAVYRIEKD